MDRVEWHSISLFKDLAPGELEIIKPYFELRRIPAGQAAISEGEQGDEMFILVEGSVRISKSMLLRGMALPLAELTNPRKVLATLDQTHYPAFGEMALLDRDIRSATVEVLTDAAFLVTNRERFFALTESEPRVGCKLLSAIGRRMAGMVRKNNNDLVKLTTALALALGKNIGA